MGAPPMGAPYGVSVQKYINPILYLVTFMTCQS